MAKPRAFISSLLFSLSLLVLGACDSDGESCADGACERDEPDPASQPNAPPPPTIPCRPVCEALTGGCSPDTPGDTTSVRATADCIDWCEAGGLSADEAACLESIDCDSAGDCLAD